MALPNRKWLRHETPKWVRSDKEVFFVTVCGADRGSDALVANGMAERLLESVQERQTLELWWVHVFMIMPDHVHALVSFPRNGAGMKRTVANWKRWTAGNLGTRWQRGFFDHRLRGSEGFDEKVHYVRMNPVRAGLVSEPEQWPHYWPR